MHAFCHVNFTAVETYSIERKCSKKQQKEMKCIQWMAEVSVEKPVLKARYSQNLHCSNPPKSRVCNLPAMTRISKPANIHTGMVPSNWISEKKKQFLKPCSANMNSHLFSFKYQF